MNGRPPEAGKPALMSLDEVRTLFHEFGHATQHMFTEVEDGGASGLNLVEWDAVELPSQLMENWCWEREALDLFSRHHESGDTLPDDLFERLPDLGELDLDLPIRVLSQRRLATPLSWGLRSPVVLLPRGATTWSRGRLRAVLLHRPGPELAASADPDAVLTDFLQSTYEAAADLAGWDRAGLETPPGFPYSVA